MSEGRKRVCFLCDSIFTIGGVQRVTAVIAKALADDYDVTIMTLDPPPSTCHNQPSTLHLPPSTPYGLAESKVAFRFFAYPTCNRMKMKVCKCWSAIYRKCHLPWRWASDAYAHSSFPSPLRNALASALRQGDYDIIVGVHAPLAIRLAACRPMLGNAKLIGWVHNSHEALFGSGSTYIGPELRRHYEHQLSKLDETIVLSNFDSRCYPFPTRVIYNPLTLIPGRHSDGTSKRFLAIGRFSHLHKGFDLLIKAFAIFAKQDAEWTLDIVGEGPEEQLYRQLIADNHLQNRITIHPFTNDVQSYYSQAQVYVLSSRWEGFGLVLVEAMAHGLPIVSSDLPTSHEIMGDFGLYFPVGDVDAMARQLHEATLLDWSSRSAEALHLADRFQLSTIIEEWKKLF